jgi:archaellum component FlaC
MTNDELQAAVAANTKAIGALVSQFIRPNAQQSLENQQSIAQIISLLDRHAQAIVQIDERLERTEDIVEASARQIASNAEAITRFDERLEETRQLVAKNASDIAQLGVKVNLIADKVDSNAEQITALAEMSRSQLAAIIGNGRRIDRLEQQAS